MVTSGGIAIPEIQRPFVWDKTKVRDFIDSLYQGYPVGYIISWQNPDVKLKDGSISQGKKILIDGQQRITAMTAALVGQKVIDKDYSRIRIRIAFNPLKERFEVTNPAIEKDKEWIVDISEVLNGQHNILHLVKTYKERNPGANEDQIVTTFSRLMSMTNVVIGEIQLSHDLDIETVTEIFIRINSKGVVLSQADFAMSKIASNTDYDGNTLRKAIDYFCHLAIAPEFHRQIEDNDPEFAQTDFYNKMQWLKRENEDLYDPNYTDLIRVAFTSQFNRGKLSDLVSLLSGRNFETRSFEDEIAEQSFSKLRDGVNEFINETNFKRFIMILKSAGFIVPSMIRSGNAINFAYVLYLKLKQQGIPEAQIGSYVNRWFVYSVLTGRYSGSPESRFDQDIRMVASRHIGEILEEKERAELSEAFWDAGLIQSFDTSVSSSPYFIVFLASQVKNNDRGFLSKDVFVRELIELRGDIHHLFPRDYLKKNGLPRGKYNQIANYVYMQSEINIKVGNKPPEAYFSTILKHIADGDVLISGIRNKEDLKENLASNCIPEQIMYMNIDDYDTFLDERRYLMAQKIKSYYLSL